MSETIKIQEHLKPATCMCIACQRVTHHDVLTSAEIANTLHISDDYEIDQSDLYQTLRCRGCESVTLRKESWSSDEVDIDDMGRQYWPTKTEYFPSRESAQMYMADAYLLPQEIYSIYIETKKALIANMPLLAAVGLRAIIEGVCRFYGVDNKGTLAAMVSALAADGHVTNADAKVLHDIRDIGNLAAHEARAHTLDEIKIALRAVEHLLNGAFVMPHYTKTLPPARPKKLPQSKQTQTQTPLPPVNPP